MPPGFPSPSFSPFGPQPFPLVLRNVLIGCGTASFWRGAWYILDDNLFPQDPVLSASTSLLSGTAGMFLAQGLIKRYEVLLNHRSSGIADTNINSTATRRKSFATHPSWHRNWRKSAYRFGAIYWSALSVVLVWRGAWLSWDCFYEGLHSKQAWHASKSSFLHHSVYHNIHFEDDDDDDEEKDVHWEPVDATSSGHATKSGLFSHLTAMALLLGLGTFASVLAPPAAISILHDATIRSRYRVAATSSRISSRTTFRSSPAILQRQARRPSAVLFQQTRTRLATPISRYRRLR